MERRRFLQTVGAVTTVGAVGSGSVLAEKEGERPSDEIDTTNVSIFTPNPNNAVEVPTGNWLRHIWGWVDGEGENSEKEDVQRYIDAVELDVFIDGEEIDNPDQYWGEVHQDEDGNWVAWWEYFDQPKPPGLYDFTVVFNFPEGFEDPGPGENEDLDEDDVPIDVPPGTTDVWTGYYRVLNSKRQR